MINKNNVVQALYCSVDGQNIVGYNATSDLSGTVTMTAAGMNNAVYTFDNTSNGTLWNYWQNQYYPYVIRESYPVYIQEKAMDKGKQAFELLKALMDKGLVKVDKVKDFIEAMDVILKTL